jgi:hypothetical protein
MRPTEDIASLVFHFSYSSRCGARMPATYEIDKERRLVVSTATGPFAMADGLAHQERLRKDPDFDPGFSQLMDLTAVTEYEIGVAEIQVLAQRGLFSSVSRRAIVVQSDLGYGLARMFEMFRENAGELGIRVFRDREEALDWVAPRNLSA